MFLCSFNTDDECFYVGLGHRGQSQTARKSNFMGSDEYRPFQCCPTKLERATKVPKMTAQRLANKNTNEKTAKTGHFEFNAEPTRSTRAEELSKSGAKKTAAATGDKIRGAAKPAVDRKSDTKGAEKKKDSKKDKAQKTGQKGLLGIGKVVDWL